MDTIGFHPTLLGDVWAKFAGLLDLGTSALRVSYGGPVPTNGHRCRIACDEEALRQCECVQCSEEALTEGADTL